MRSDEQRAEDDARLLASGEPVLMLKAIAPLLPLSLKDLEWLLSRKTAPQVRYIVASRPTLYCVRDVREAVALSADRLEARRLRGIENTRLSIERNAVEHEKALARKALLPPKATKQKQTAPEVIVRRRR